MINLNYYNNFNLLRLLAALQVVYIHAVEHLHITNSIILCIRDVIRYFPGVPVFFLISGYLITLSYEKNKNIYNYARNRILRIFPGLYMSFLISLIILWIFNQFTNVEIIKVVIWSFAQLSIFQFYNPEFIRDFGVGVINGSLWTISVELTFYILLPLIYIFLKRLFFIRIVILLGISLAFYYYIYNISSGILIYEKLIKVSILPYLFYFLFGYLFYIYREKLIKYIENKIAYFFIFYFLIVYFHIDNFLYEILEKVIFTFFVFSFVFSFKTLSYTLMKHNDYTYGIYIPYVDY